MPKADFAFFHPFRVRYSEIDRQGIAFNAHYLTWYDTAITEYFRWLPYAYHEQLHRTGTDFHTVRTVVEYARPIYFDEDIEVHARVAKLGRSSLTFLLEIHPAGDDALYATGEVVWVNTDQTTRRAAPVPEDLIPLLEAREGERMERK